MSIKFNLNYKIVVQDINNNQHIITSIAEETNIKNNKYVDKLNSLAVKINIEKTNTTTAQKCKIEIINLNENTRKLLKKSKLDTNIYRQIQVYSGYQDYLTLIFQGNIQSCESYRQNNDFITSINANCDFGIINGNVNISLKPSYSKKDLIDNIINNMPHTNKGYINYDTLNLEIGARGRTYQCKAWDLLNEINKNSDVYIDNETIYIMSEQEVLNQSTLILSAETGLLQEPREYDGYLEVKTLFEPLANINNFIVLDSKVRPEYNGNYKLIGYTHSLQIEKIGKQTEGTTTFKLLFSTTEFKKVNQR